MRTVEVNAAGLRLSGLLAVPPASPPKAVIVALHGAGMSAGYFHSQADPAASLLSLAAARGYAALALDRPGYGVSVTELPDGLELDEQAGRIRHALTDYRGRHPAGAGFFIVGHSLGGKLALTVAAGWSGDALLGVDVSGISDRWAVDPAVHRDMNDRRTRPLSWGPLRLYPPGTFRHAMELAAPIPLRELAEIPHWPHRYPDVARRVRVPVRFTFAEYERWWRCDPQTVEAMTARLAAPLVRTERLAEAGHNISLGYAARDYHLGVLTFVEECLGRSETGKG